MGHSPFRRSIGELTFPEISRRLKDSSILCLPIGAIEQHGAHLPLNTDVVVAEELTRALIARWVALIAMLGLLALVIATSRIPCVPYGLWPTLQMHCR